MPFQDEWRFCFKCATLYFNGFDFKGRCAAGDTHFGEGSLNYQLNFDVPVNQNHLAGFLFCNKCNSLCLRKDFGSGSDLGRCAAGGRHDLSTSLAFVVNRDVPQTHGQGLWVVCVNCNCVHHSPEGQRPCAGSGDLVIGHNPREPLLKVQFEGGD